MNIELKEITVRQLTNGYQDNEEGGTATAATTATTTIILPQPHAVGRVSSPDKWFASYCVHCGAACWLSETINPHDPAGFLDQGVNDAVYVAQKMNTAAAAAGHKLPFPKRARGIVIFGEVFGEPCKSNPKLLLCGDLNG